MTPKVKHADAADSALRDLSEELLGGAIRPIRTGSALAVYHPSAPRLTKARWCVSGNGVSLTLSQGDGTGDPAETLVCSSASLPFQDDAFQAVVFHHVIAHGEEAELAEACRVLAPDGTLILLGLNRWGWRYLAQRGERRLPGIAPHKVRSRLALLDMQIESFAGAGIFNRPRPVTLGSGLRAAAAPLADVVILKACHRDKPEITPLRFGEPRSKVVQSAAMRG